MENIEKHMAEAGRMDLSNMRMLQNAFWYRKSYIKKFTIVEIQHCLRCGVSWFPEVEKYIKNNEITLPKRCPSCTSRLWNSERVRSVVQDNSKQLKDFLASNTKKYIGTIIIVPFVVCLRCGHERWLTTKSVMENKRPGYCIKCNSPYWDRPRRNEGI